jgi:hypothetical protein
MNTTHASICPTHTYQNSNHVLDSHSGLITWVRIDYVNYMCSHQIIDWLSSDISTSTVVMAVPDSDISTGSWLYYQVVSDLYCQTVTKDFQSLFGS